MSKQRIWELDALRGIAILGVIVIHLLFDLQFFLNIDLLQNPIVNFIKNFFCRWIFNCHIFCLFILIN